VALRARGDGRFDALIHTGAVAMTTSQTRARNAGLKGGPDVRIAALTAVKFK
jgi:hypothetical protein